MFDSTVLDVAIGLIFIYIVLSLICLSTNELIASLLKSRAKNLENGLKELLQDPKAVENGLVQKLYRHPIIDGMYRGDYGGTGDRKPVLPSYISARNFALAILDLIKPATAATSSGATAAAPALGSQVLPPATATNGTSRVADLRTALFESPLFQTNKEFCSTLITLLDSANHDMAQVRANIETWYDSAMDSVSGWYKRKTQYVVLGIGLGLAVATNADTFTIVTALSQNRALRESLVKDSQDYDAIVRNQAAAKSVGGAVQPDQTPEQWLEAKVAGVKPLGLPLGWEWGNLITPSYWFKCLPGWLITGFAVSLGAPFWFDLLNKFMVIRSTVKPHEKSREQASRD